MNSGECPMPAFNFKTATTIRGFTLIETVVALAILAMTLTVVYQSFGWTLRRGAEQRHREWAWLTAESLLNQMRADHAFAIGRQSGATSQGLTWESMVEPYALRLDASSPLRPLQVTVAVSWGKQQGQHIELRSIEFGAAK